MRQRASESMFIAGEEKMWIVKRLERLVAEVRVGRWITSPLASQGATLTLPYCGCERLHVYKIAFNGNWRAVRLGVWCFDGRVWDFPPPRARPFGATFPPGPHAR